MNCAIICVCLTAPIAANVEKPGGEYGRWSITLPESYYGEADKPGDVSLWVWTRGGKAVRAMASSPSGQFRYFRDEDTSGLKADGNALTGTLTFHAHAEGLKHDATWPNARWSITLDARHEGGKVSGTFEGESSYLGGEYGRAIRGEDKHADQIRATLREAHEKAGVKVTGKLSGEHIVGEAYRKAEAIPEGAEWPQWLGPDGTLRGPTSGDKLNHQLDEARLVWRSEQELLPGKAQVTRYGGFGIHFRKPSGGGSSPVIADGKIYLYYYTPASEDFDKFEKQKREPLGYFMPEMWKFRADDVILCADAATGETLWKATFPSAGKTFLTGKSNLINNTMVVHAGTAFAVGGAGRVYALDAETGKLKWQSDIGKAHEEAIKTLEREVAEGKTRSAGRAFPHALNAADGVVAVADERGGLIGFDAETGKELWKLDDSPGRFVSPRVWRHGMTSHFITLNEAGTVKCVAARTGKVAWELETGGTRDWGQTTPYIQGDYLVVQGKVASLTGYLLTPERAEKAWELPSGRYTWPSKIGGNGGFVKLDEGHFAFASDSRMEESDKPYFVAVNAETGEVTSELTPRTAPINWNGPLFVSGDGLIIARRDNGHHDNEYYAFRADPRDLELLGGLYRFPHLPTTSYEVPLVCPIIDGRLFVRGAFGLYCYDLRQD